MSAAKGGTRTARKVYKPASTITARIHLMGRKYEATGENVTSALEALRIEGTPRGRGILVVSNGERTVERILQPAMVVRLFSMSPLMRQTQLKNLYLMIQL